MTESKWEWWQDNLLGPGRIICTKVSNSGVWILIYLFSGPFEQSEHDNYYSTPKIGLKKSDHVSMDTKKHKVKAPKVYRNINVWLGDSIKSERRKNKWTNRSSDLNPSVGLTGRMKPDFNLQDFSHSNSIQTQNIKSINNHFNFLDAKISNLKTVHTNVGYTTLKFTLNSDS